MPQGPRTQGGSQRSGPPRGAQRDGFCPAEAQLCAASHLPQGRESWAEAERQPGTPLQAWGWGSGQGSASFPGRYSQAHLLSKVTRRRQVSSESRSLPLDPCLEAPMGLNSLQPRVPNLEVLSPRTPSLPGGDAGLPTWRGCCWRLGMVPTPLMPRKGSALQHREASSPKRQQGRQWGGPHCHRVTEATQQPCSEGPPDPLPPQILGRPSEVPGGQAGRNSP